MIEKLMPREFDQVFDIMKTSFPEDEYRTYQEQKALLDVPEYQIFVLRDDAGGQIKAFIAVWDFNTAAFIEHFAVNPQYRNGGLGSKMLNELSDKLGKMIVLEVELPENQMAARRIEFYRRNNFFLNEYPYTMPALAKNRNAVNMKIMTLGRSVTQEEFNNIKTLLYSKVYKVV